jgi:predicted DNA-binding transcriptional regulator YafY
MGLADAASAARMKVSAALHPELGDAHLSAAQRFHLDAPGWWQPPQEAPKFLSSLADAVWDDRTVRMRYKRRGAEVERELEPYGLVLKAGVWYLAARITEAGDRRVYRVDRVTGVEETGQRFVREEEFELPAFWDERAAAFAQSILRDEVVLRLTAEGARMLPYATDRRAAEEALEKAESGTAGAEGTGTEGAGPEETGTADGESAPAAAVTVTLPVESLDVAYEQLLALGPECEVLEPAALRARFADAARRMAARYEP